jgi:hypothetical protein
MKCNDIWKCMMRLDFFGFFHRSLCKKNNQKQKREYVHELKIEENGQPPPAAKLCSTFYWNGCILLFTGNVHYKIPQHTQILVLCADNNNHIFENF